MERFALGGLPIYHAMQTRSVSPENPAGDMATMYRWHIMDPICFEKELRVNVQALTEIENVTGKNDIVFASPTDGQITAYEQYSDLMLFIDEGIQNFMTGKEPMDKWDEFVESCKNMGIDEAAAIMQERYDSADAVLAKFS